MTLDELDRALDAWNRKLRTVSENILELTQLDAYKRLKGEDGWPRAQLTGLTAQRVAPALQALGELWEHYARFLDVLKQAQDLRKSVNAWMPNRKTLDDIEFLLTGASVHLPAAAKPLEQRSLLSGVDRTDMVTPERVLEVMTAAFPRARDVIVAVEKAWNHLLPALTAQDNEAVSLQRQAEELGVPALPELTDLRERITALLQRVDHDPLGVNDQCDRIASELQQVRARLGELGRERDQTTAALTEARQLAQRLEEAHRQSREAYEERQLKVQVDGEPTFPAPLPDEQLAALAPWLTRLEATLREGRWKAARVGLDRWCTAARGYLSAEEATRQANQAPLRERRDLRGLLDALRARARDVGRAEEVALNAVAEQAIQLLNMRPTPLIKVRELVHEYESRLL